MSAYLIQGGSPLFGEVTVQGAKNSVLPILAATILTGAVSVLHNCPQLTDVDASVAILRHLGCVVVQDGETITVDSSQAPNGTFYFGTDAMGCARSAHAGDAVFRGVPGGHSGTHGAGGAIHAWGL